MNTERLRDPLVLGCSTLEAAVFPTHDIRGVPADRQYRSDLTPAEVEAR